VRYLYIYLQGTLMSNAVESSLKSEIARREKELERLREALRVLGGGKGRGPGVGRGRGPRGPKTEAQKRKISLALKKAWARRKKAASAAA
jgi:hypothetical protein